MTLFAGMIGVGAAVTNGVLTEPTDPSYARQPLAMIAGGPGSVNNNIAAFRPLTGTWPTLGFAAVYDGTGAMVWHGALAAPVVPETAQTIAFLPGGFTSSNGAAPFDPAATVVASLVAWQPNPQRTIDLVPPGLVQQGVTSTVPPLAKREPLSTVDDTIDITGQLAPGDFPTSATMTSASGAITEVWCAWQGPLITARSTGTADVSGATYERTLAWATNSGAAGSVQLDQTVYASGAPTGVDPQISALAMWTQAGLDQAATSLAQEGGVRAAGDAALQGQITNLGTTVESAQTASQTALTDAETALSTAQGAATTAAGAVTTADGAVTTAGTALTAAQGAATIAAQALTAADGAETTAAGAVTTADGAAAAAETALNTAQGAATIAGQALTAAQGATTAAAGAVATAEDADTVAGQALTAAQGATTASADAVATAEDAANDASQALSTAQGAATTAEGAVITAQGAAASAGQASATAGQALSSAEAAQSTAAAAVQTAQGAAATASAEQSRAEAAEQANAAAIAGTAATVGQMQVQVSTIYSAELADANAIAALTPIVNAALPTTGGAMTGPLDLDGQAPQKTTEAVSWGTVLNLVSGVSNYAVTLGTPAGTWNASTNTPPLSNGGAGGTAGQALVVATAGSTALDGNATWNIGDVAYNTGTAWIRLVNPGGSGALTTLTMPAATYSYDGTPDGTKVIADPMGNVIFRLGASGLQTINIIAQGIAASGPISTTSTLAVGGAASIGGALAVTGAITSTGTISTSGTLVGGSISTSGPLTAASAAFPGSTITDSGTGGPWAKVIVDPAGNVVLGITNDGTLHLQGIIASATSTQIANFAPASLAFPATGGGSLFAVDDVAQTVTLAGGSVFSIDSSSDVKRVQDSYGNVIGRIDATGKGYGIYGGGAAASVGASGSYSAAMIATRDAINVANSAIARSQPMTRYAPLTGGIVHIFGYGQSLSGGWDGVPVLSTTQPFDNLMIGGQTRAAQNSSQAPITTTWVPVGSATGAGGTYPFNPMIATSANQNSISQGETPGEGAVNYLRRAYLQKMSLAANPNCRFVLTNCGIGGQDIAALSKGATPNIYNRLLDAANAVKAAAVANGLSYQVGGVIWTQGEQDVSEGTSGAAYTAAFQTLQANFLTDVVQGIAGQPASTVVPWFSGQPDSNASGDTMAIHKAILDLANTPNSDLYLTGPLYQYPDHSIHLTANGYRWHANQIGKTMARVMLNGMYASACYVKRATFLGNSVLIDLNVPAPPLILGDAYVQYVKTVYPNLGFIVSDASGLVTILSATIAGEATILLTLARALGGSPVLQAGNNQVLSTDYGTNLCDSDTTFADDSYIYNAGTQDAGEDITTWNGAPLIGQPYPLNNYLAATYLPIIADPIYS
jgi:hypothetical protein